MEINKQYDLFGIEKKYATTENGQEWFMDMENFSQDHQITTSSDGIVKVKNQKYWNGKPDRGMNPPSFRVNVFTKDGNRNATKDHRKAHNDGYMADPSDWKNLEFTAYCRVNSPEDMTEEITIYARGGNHTNGKKFSTKSCTGTAYKPGIEFNGNPSMKKEYWHSGGYQDIDPNTNHVTIVAEEELGSVDVNIQNLTNSTGPNNIAGKWIGIKAIFYNLEKITDIDQGPAVKIEVWYDIVGTQDFDVPPNKWIQYFSVTDDGTNMGTKGKTGSLEHGDGCNAISPREIFNWGGPEVTLRIDKIKNVDFKWLSVREINKDKPL